MVEVAPTPEGTVRVPAKKARGFTALLFSRSGVPAAAADLIAEVLVSADMRGIRSHGLARVSYFLTRLERGVISPHTNMSFTANTATTGVLDAGNAIGIVAADRAMNEAMSMASAHGCGFVVVKDSSHFGYAGFWAERAMRAGYIGISLSNSGGRVAPTFGSESLMGTNPLSVAMPGAPDATDFLLDMATSAVAVGKVEATLREERPIPDGWMAATSDSYLDDNGVLSFDAPLLPLGGEGTERGGHKGYGLALMVELLCGALGGTSFDDRIAGATGVAPAAMGHMMGALRIDGFRQVEEVQRDMEATFDRIRQSTRVPGHDRIYIHGEPEALAEKRAAQEGIAIAPTIMEQLESWSNRLDIESLIP